MVSDAYHKPSSIFTPTKVPATLYNSLNMRLINVPPGDDYFLLFVNSTHGLMYATSNRFTILAPSTSPNSSQPSAVGTSPTITVNGGPDPTKLFGTTFPPDPNAEKSGARGGMRSGHGWFGIVVATVVCALSASLVMY